jgi:hypothetical protein
MEGKLFTPAIEVKLQKPIKKHNQNKVGNLDLTPSLLSNGINKDFIKIQNLEIK